MRNYDIFVAKIYDYALIDSFWGFPGFIDSLTSYATLVLHGGQHCLYLVWVLLQWFSKQSKHFSVSSASNLEKYWKKSAFQVYRQGRVRGGIRSGSIRDGGGGSTWPVALPPPPSARAPPVSWQQAGRSTLEEVEDWHWSCKIKTTLFPSISSWEGKVLWLDLVKTL